jgi:hypothetical protein
MRIEAREEVRCMLCSQAVFLEQLGTLLLSDETAQIQYLEGRGLESRCAANGGLEKDEE